ncbi:sulfate transporter [Uliginosibacterium sp. H1]|uniref:sulfate transporter n=1 Tax=Uliginosibacterium sp. H1 TaxID=3114757 RepID=UPI002E17A817|nr:sulfate transporter [Uliginosibacterium sp. H1]
MVLSSFFGKKPSGNDRDADARGKGDHADQRLETTSTLEFTHLGDGRALQVAAGKIHVSEGNSNDSAAVEEAAILFANASDDGACAVLEAAIDASGGHASEVLWQMLFDLYRLTGNRQPFEERGVAFAQQYEMSPPVWDQDQPVAKGPSKDAGPSVNLTGTLSGNARTQFDQLVRIGAKSGKLRVDLGKLKGVDDTGAQLLAETLASLKRQKVAVVLLGARHALGLVLPKLKVGEREGRDYWLLALDLLQQLGDEAAFEDMAVNFAVSFEESPPSYEPPVVVAPEPDPAVETGGLSLVPIEEEGDRFVLEGEVGGAQPEALRKLAVFASQRTRIEIDAKRLRRLEFVSAGGLFNQLAQLQGQGKLTVIYHPNAMVAALMRVMGIDQVAQIEARKQG